MDNVKQIEVFNLKDNDIVIVRTEYLLAEKTKESIEKTWENIFEKQGYKNIKVIAMSNQLGLEVISR